MADVSSTSLSFLGVVVAAGAVVVSLIGAVIQYMMLQGTRQNTISSLRVGAAEVEIANLRDKLSEYMLLVYDVESAFKDAMANKKPYPGEHYEQVKRETVLWHSIRLHLRSDSEAQIQLLAALNELRNDTSKLWANRSDNVIEKANVAFALERRLALGQ